MCPQTLVEVCFSFSRKSQTKVLLFLMLVMRVMKKRYRVGYTCGVFDLFHIGHLNLLERCKALCDRLIVGVCDDTYVRDVKHKIPIVLAEDRIRLLKALRVVDDAQLVSVEETNNKLLAQN